MNRTPERVLPLLKLTSLLALMIALQAHGEKIWTNDLSGLWRDGTNWTGHTAPELLSFIRITNANTKTITIDALTDATNLTVQKLTISAPPGATNTLLLTGLGTNNPLVFQTGLEMMDGAAIRITNSALVLNLTNDHVNIDGSLILDSGAVDLGGITVTARVGRVTSGTLAINSGSVSAGTMTVGGLTNSTGVVNMNGGTLSIASLLSIGRNLGTTGLVFITGGQLNAVNDDTRIGDSGVGEMTVSNATVWLTNLYVGRDGLSAGTLTVQAGGSVGLSNDIAIARFRGAAGTVFMSGGQLTALGQKIYLGREGNGQMTLSNGSVQAAHLLIAADVTNTASGVFTMTGGSLSLATNFLVGGVSFSTGQVSVAGGSIVVTNPAHTAVLSVPNGSVTFNAGTITTDNLLLTNAAGQFTFNGGMLNTKGTTVANGAPFVLGNGIVAATMHMDGGIHSFANGLIISSNATLNGCGTVIGSIINHGNIATNCGAILVQPTITSVVRTGTTNTIIFPSVSGQTYIIEFKNALTNTTWTPILPSTNGSGGVVSLKDTSATVPSRFYRVRAQ